MNPLTHSEARTMIELRADNTLDLKSDELLNAHIQECSECTAYANELDEVEALLQRVTHHKWDRRPAPLAVEALIHSVEGKSFGQPKHLVTTRMGAIIVAVLAMLIGTWQFSRMALSPTPQILTLALPRPTPSLQLTGTDLSVQGCEYIIYEVDENDTLDRISAMFAVPTSDIMAFNKMETDIISMGAQLKIPLCKSTPTVTISAPTSTITITPQINPVTTTPG